MSYRTKIAQALITAGFFCAATVSPAQQNDLPSRVFKTIQVVGNDRFRDGDVLATSGLQTGVPLGEADLVSAVEALEYTGEFKDVLITSNGDVLTITVKEAPEYSGGLTFGAGYDSDIGGFGAMGLNLKNAFGNNTEIGANLLISKEVRTLRARIRSDNFWSQGINGGVRLSFEQYEFDNTAYDYEAAKIEPYVVFDVAEKALVELRYTLSSKEISNVDPNASAILLAEEGRRTSSGVGFSFATGSSLIKSETAPIDAWSIRFDQDFTGLGGDTDLSLTKLSVFGRKQLSSSGFALRTRLEMGAVKGLSGDKPRASERFTLGGASLRGFARGTISPRDTCVGCAADGGDISTILGGDYYAVLRTDLLVPIFKNRPEIETFLFFDTGSVWGLDTNTAPSGTLSDSRKTRSSAGIGASFDTKVGKFESYFAIDASSDEGLEEKQSFGLTFRSEF